jgi:hypothetical protein
MGQTFGKTLRISLGHTDKYAIQFNDSLLSLIESLKPKYYFIEVSH